MYIMHNICTMHMKTFHVCFLQSYNSFPLDSKKHTEFLSVISVKGAKKKEEKKRNGFTIYPCIKEMTYM